MTELLDRLAATCDKQRVEIDALRAEIERLHQTWVRGDLTQTDFDKAFRETEQ